ncbi:acyltransferase [Thalassotalea eurytherma]|uniref:Transferase n=1 Tax=Thalassotalea eurytherma TaxID=1144278 RepID=A0ABQ6H1V4_9GAMM|nr:acyltransferase [Thalassotalea eurytherma]GLX82092.1 transferase [Thalassotalea eurytherma]
MKLLLKQLISIICLVAIFPFIILFYCFKGVANADSLIASFSQFLSLVPGKLGSYLRANFYRVTLNHCSPFAFIGFGTIFSHQDTKIEEGVYIGPQGNIGKCQIEKDCLLGSGVHILSGKSQHNISDLDIPIREQGGVFQRIVIGENSWIGNGAIVMANVGKQCIVAAGAVVVNDVPDYAIVAGNPAKIIKMRND